MGYLIELKFYILVEIIAFRHVYYFVYKHPPVEAIHRPKHPIEGCFDWLECKYRIVGPLIARVLARMLGLATRLAHALQ